MTEAPEAAPPRANPLRSRWGMALIPLAAAVVLAGAVFGVEGLAANPVVSVAPSGQAVLAGSFQPVACPAGSAPGCVQGYVQAGARSVFLVLPSGCAVPAAGSSVRVTARRDPQAGSQAYMATACLKS